MAVEAAIEVDSQCYGCVPDGPFSPGSVCASTCYTPCEVWQLANLALPGAYDDQIAARVARLQSQQSWVCRYSEAGKVRPPTYHAEIWVAALYVAMIQLGGGVGSIVPENLPEYIVFLCGIILGSVTWAMVVGTICATMATGDPHTNAFKQNMDSLNYFLNDMNMPNELRIRAREYLRNGRDLIKKYSYNELVAGLSPDLRADIVLHMSAATLEQVWYLGDLEQAARVELAVRLTREGYPAREKVAQHFRHAHAVPSPCCAHAISFPCALLLLPTFLLPTPPPPPSAPSSSLCLHSFSPTSPPISPPHRSPACASTFSCAASLQRRATYSLRPLTGGTTSSSPRQLCATCARPRRVRWSRSPRPPAHRAPCFLGLMLNGSTPSAPPQALTYIEVACLSRESLEEVREAPPASLTLQLPTASLTFSDFSLSLAFRRLLALTRPLGAEGLPKVGSDHPTGGHER